MGDSAAVVVLPGVVSNLNEGFAVRKSVFFAAIVSAVALLAVPARAEVVVLTGSTEGCFGTGCTPGAAGANVYQGLTYTPTSFYAQTDNTGYGTIFNLGEVQLSSAVNSYSGEPFTLELVFSSPTGTSPGSSTFAALLTGDVITTSNGPGGGVTFNFGPEQWFNFQGGEFSVLLNPVSIQPNDNPAYIQAQVQAVPEPGTWALMGIGFACLGFVAYRRRGSGAATLRLV